MADKRWWNPGGALQIDLIDMSIVETTNERYKFWFFVGEIYIFYFFFLFHITHILE